MEKNSQNKITVAISEYLKKMFIPLSVLIVLIIIASIVSDVFFSSANFENLLIQLAVNMIVSMGMLTVILTGGIDLSVGSIVGVCGVLCAGFMRTTYWWAAIAVAVIFGLIIGLANGIIVARLKIAPFIVTLGMMSFARGLAYWYTNATPIILSMFEDLQDMDPFYAFGGGRLFGFIPIPAIVWLAVAIITFFLLRYTTVGRVTYAVGGNEEAVRLSGINLKKYKLFPYAYTGLLAGFAGALLASRLRVGAPLSGQGLELDSIAAVVIGGTSLSGGVGSVSGVVIGVFVLGIIDNILNLMNVPAYPQMMLKGVIVVAAVIASTREAKKGKLFGAKA
jgi:ribose transport system permease protein